MINASPRKPTVTAPGTHQITPVDAARWRDVAAVPSGTLAALRGAVADRLFRHAAAALDVRVSYPDGTYVGKGSDEHTPTMTICYPEAFARRLGATGLIGFGEGYMARDWDADDLVGALTPFAARVDALIPRPLQIFRRLALPALPVRDQNSLANARGNVSRHYDLSNDLFAAFLDETMTYSSALFDVADSTVGRHHWSDLAAAQRRKIDRLLDLAGVGKGTRLLEIGTGWGELSVRAAQRGAVVTSVTLSTEQRDIARQRARDAGLSGTITVELLDYRQVEGTYDAVVSVEMVEAVGLKHLAEYFARIRAVLAPRGRAAIQAITMPHERMIASRNSYTWIHKYIFPGGQISSVPALRTAAHKAGLRVVDTYAMGSHYGETLRLWRERFTSSLTRVHDIGFDTTFTRMWEFYLAYSESGFRSGYLDVQQILFRAD